jgi:hypothetical protein
MKRNSVSPEASTPTAASGDKDQGHDPDFASGLLPLALRELAWRESKATK